MRASRADVRVGLWGIGSVGRHVARLLLEHRQGIEIVAAATEVQADVGRPLGELVGADNASGPLITGSLAEVLGELPDIVVMATGSFLPDVLDDVLACIDAGASVVSPCEELAFPFTRDPSAADQIGEAARTKGVGVLATGICPGFLFDSFLCAASGVCWDVRSIRGRRVVNVAGFGENIHLRLGIGYTLEEFESGHKDGSIAGHVGFPETIEIICRRMGLTLDSPVEQVFEPKIAANPAPTKYGAVAAGRTEGFVHRAIGRVAGQELLNFELLLHLRPEAAGFRPTDTFEIEGVHRVSVTLDPGMDPLLATSAILVNSIPGVLSGPPGLRTVSDLPAAAAWADMQHVHQD